MPDVPNLVEDGWTQCDDIVGGYRLLTYADGTVRFEHRCDRGSRGVIICAPALCIGPYAGTSAGTHVLTRNAVGQPTVRASVLCPDCGTHGFITDGVWA